MAGLFAEHLIQALLYRILVKGEPCPPFGRRGMASLKGPNHTAQLLAEIKGINSVVHAGGLLSLILLTVSPERAAQKYMQEKHFSVHSNYLFSRLVLSSA
jgi:hypothetical protein